MNSINLKAIGGITLVFVILLSACSLGVPRAVVPTQPVVVPTEVPDPTATAAPIVEDTAAPEAPAGLVASLDTVKDATIQIEAQGTFLDPQVGLLVNAAGRGSGFIIDPSGIAVTNNHVVTGAALLKVWVGGDKNKVYNARVLGASECSDLAVIKIDGADFPYMEWYGDTPKVGLEVYAAGYPLGDPEFTLTKGIVSKANADGRSSWSSVGSVLEHDARINPGNSGGPLVSSTGQVVGINYANNASNQFFAIARNEADRLLNELKDGKDVNSIGVNGMAVMSEDQTLTGVWVSSVKSGSPADKSGVKAGDIIVELEGLVLSTDGTMADYCQILRSHEPEDTLSMAILRWQTQEILEGQLNGRDLVVTATYGQDQQASEDIPQDTGDSDNVIVADDYDVIAMYAPADWEYDGSPWESTWTIGRTEYDFFAQTLTISPDVQAYYERWDMPGLTISTSVDWGNLGGYANLLEGIQSAYSDCKPNGSYKYEDGTYEGQMQLYAKCGSNSNALVLAARPVVNPQSYLVLVQLQYNTQEEFDLLDALFSTAVIVP